MAPITITPTGDGEQHGQMELPGPPSIPGVPSYDPTQPLCSFFWSVSWVQTGRDAKGAMTYRFTKWSNWEWCQIETAKLDVQGQLLDPFFKTTGPTSETSCDRCTGPVKAVLPDFICAPCWYQGTHDPTGTGVNYSWTFWPLYTIVFEQPGLNAYEHWTVSEQQYDHQSCPEGDDQTTNHQNFYKYVCDRYFIQLATAGPNDPATAAPGYTCGGRANSIPATCTPDGPPAAVPEVGAVGVYGVGALIPLVWARCRARARRRRGAEAPPS